ncbi:hypothetical protein [Streptacidiphilus sp. P02-A3a]|uniref:hypothetical protein n=1 Tax=Streptacidiphilus sp. P02-A3a TaxID=2704468 RepID=UPI0015F80BD0|nr:hypothetical protein [Streptacidiphilus sp. P02-A3a]QMU71538.1 hypothetical protein GXP74_28190 [Streptacidiphilus sp. P02-A3a]
MMGRTGTRRRTGARLRIAGALLAAVAALLGFGPAPGASAAAPAAVPAAVHAAVATDGTTCVPTGEGGTRCTGTYGSDTAWDNYADQELGGMISAEPVVSVDQTVNLSNQMVHVSWSNFTPSGYEGNGDQATGLSNGFRQSLEFYPVFVVECKGAAPQSLDACNEIQVGASTSGAPGNAVESYTQAGATTQASDCSDVPTDPVCGTGYTDIQIQTRIQNNNLGCDSNDPCSIAVLPQWGGNTYAQPTNCEDHSLDLPGNGGYGSTLYGDYTSCMWNDRIVVPLSFAKTSQQLCGSNDYAFSAQGSPMLERVMGQWEPGWCTAPQGKVDFNYDSGVNEDEARSGFLDGGSSLSSSTDVALVTDPASSALTSGSSRHFTYAPIVTTSITIAYYVDNQVTQEPITDLKLNARLVAKLLTESYSLEFGQCQPDQSTQSDLCDPKVSGNPVSIFTDPEFYQLNPEYSEADFETETNGLDNNGDFLPIVLAGNSDMTYELTRWVEADPDARAFLEGQPDPWGMHVNAYYEQGVSQTYPLDQFQVLDPGFSPKRSLLGSTTNPFLSTMQVAWNPVTGLDDVASELAGWTPSGDQFYPSCSNTTDGWTTCHGNIIDAKDGADQFPQRALFAILDSGTASAYRFPTAQLVNPAGNAEAPTVDSMTAAVNAMKTNPDGVTQYQDFTDTAAGAYPLTEVQYAMVPTCGLPSAKAEAISTFLQDTANSQTYGVGLSQIPSFGGYLALDDAQQAQVMTAAQAVQRQTCKSTAPDTTVSGQKPPTTGGGSSPGSGAAPANDLSGSGTGGGSGSGAGTGTGTGGRAAGPTSPAASGQPTSQATPIALGDKAADTSGDFNYVLVSALALGALLGIGGPLAYGYGTGGFRLPRRRKRGAAQGTGGSTGGTDG